MLLPVAADFKILDVAFEEFKSTVIQVFVYNNGAIDRESTKAIDNDVMLLSVGYMLIIVRR